MVMKNVNVHRRRYIKSKIFSFIHSLARDLATYLSITTEKFRCFFQSYQLKCWWRYSFVLASYTGNNFIKAKKKST